MNIDPKIYIEMLEKDIEKYSENFLKQHREELIKKVFDTKFLYYRLKNNKGYKRFKIQKRYIKHVYFSKGKNTIIFEDNYHKFYFNLLKYGIEWVVDKKDFLPYLSINY